MYTDIATPYVTIDMDIVDSNIHKMLDTVERYGIRHRPHIKTHKSSFIAKKQLEAGCCGITCAKLSEAEVMAKHGITDILIAFPIIGSLKLERLGKLIGIADIKTIVNSLEGAKGLSNLGVEIGKIISVYIEIDGGLNRGGVLPGIPTLEFAESIRDLPNLTIDGLMYYGGTIYAENSQEEIIRKSRQERDDLVMTQKLLCSHGFSIKVLSTGSSYSSRNAQYLEGVTEVRAGNYVFNDASTLWPGLVKLKDCALSVWSTVVAKPDTNTLIIDAGSKTLTSDTGAFTKGYGYIVGHEDFQLFKLNEEHGFVRTTGPTNLTIGDVLQIIPNHSCVIPNLNWHVYAVIDGKIEHQIQIEARGMNV
ncbi:MAG: amino acid processing protein [Spirochaetae bacterium HGW-Spirochaetae-2]|jgi:D-serine deaminase-like pyridoxal phosphate-dependent protein|nr:MAG: amino acid processing protein [Spirochaetae bacterium HGW-Spirochaetae-2]